MILPRAGELGLEQPEIAPKITQNRARLGESAAAVPECPQWSVRLPWSLHAPGPVLVWSVICCSPELPASFMLLRICSWVKIGGRWLPTCKKWWWEDGYEKEIADIPCVLSGRRTQLPTETNKVGSKLSERMPNTTFSWQVLFSESQQMNVFNF